MSEYNKEQIETLYTVRQYLSTLTIKEQEYYKKDIQEYSLFRKRITDFSRKNFSELCRKKCFDNGLSACCTKEGIITYFADVFVNAINSSPNELKEIEIVLKKKGSSKDCVYLGKNGCIWKIKPIVCEMFFCDWLLEAAKENNPSIENELESLKMLQKKFTWPDKPIYFNSIERIFIEKGYTSPLMYMHNSPGLLRLKKRAGIE